MSELNNQKSVFIIAEAGVNHNGSFKIAKKLVDAAKDAGADAVKFQTFKANELVTEDAPKAEYQKKNSTGKTQHEMLKKLELSEDEFCKLSNYCKGKNILFLSTPFDTKSADFLFRLGMPIFKISSGDLTNLPLLIHIAKYGRPMILSTGMSTIEEIREAIKAIISAGNRKLTLLHCTSNYPTKYEDVNLRAMDSMKNAFPVPIGYSDHTEGIAVSIAATALGAKIIEKHFTLDQKMAGPDHRASLNINELKEMISGIRCIEAALGSKVKKPVINEKGNKKVGRRSIVANVDIPRQTILTHKMLAYKRPGTGISPIYFNKMIGKTTKQNLIKDQQIKWSHLR